MSPSQDSLPGESAIQKTLAALGISGNSYRIGNLPGSYSNFTHLLEVKADDGDARRLVLRRYNPANNEGGHDKHLCEYHALKMLAAARIPAPEPLLLDETGDLLGLPGIVTAYVAGAPLDMATEATRWGELAAVNGRLLARIHQTPFNETDKRYLMDDDVEVAWFIKDGLIPVFMRADPDGEMVWEMVNTHWRRWQPIAPRFAHTDYWAGNILWRGDEIAAVVDWEEAGYGHPAADVAYARMCYHLDGLPEAAEDFLRAYETEAGYAAPDLPLFELAACARPMTDMAGWITRPNMEERFRRFIARAKQALLAS